MKTSQGEQHLEFWQERLTNPSYVYVIQAGGEDAPIKIGKARDPRRRIKTLQTGNPFKIRLLHVLPGGEVLERNLQNRMWDEWQGHDDVNGGSEWFGFDENARLLLLMVERLADEMVASYDGSGKPPPLPSFDGLSREELVERWERIEQAVIDHGVDWAGYDLQMRGDTLELELHRMKEVGGYHCFDFDKRDEIAPRGVRLRG